MNETKIIVEPGGPRPPFAEVARHLWGDADYDSDGDSSPADSTAWTELTLINRQDPTRRIDVDPISTDPLQMQVVSESRELAEAVAAFLADSTHGKQIQ